MSLAWIGDIVDYRERQTTIARFMMGQVSGLIAGQAFGGWFGDLFGWRSTFLVILAIYVVATAGLAREMLRNPLTRDRPSEAHAPMIETFAAALRRRQVQFVLVATFLEGFLCFGAVAYITTMLH